MSFGFEKSGMDAILQSLNKDDTDPKQLSQEELDDYRLSLTAIRKAVGTKMAETSTKDHRYDDDEVRDYIDSILEDGFNLKSTELSDYPQFVEAQSLKRWKQLISERVEVSPFSTKNFKIQSLRLLRSNIAKSKTLHELRQAVALMISPLQLWNDHCVLVQKTSSKQQAIDNKEMDCYIDSLLLELEGKDKLLVERNRVIDSMVLVYSANDSEIELLRKIEIAKAEHNLSDTQVANLFSISRTKLSKLRESICLDPSSAGVTAVDVPVLTLLKQSTAPNVSSSVPLLH